MDITFIVHKQWLDNIASLPIEQQDKVIGDLVRYGAELPLAHSTDPVVASFVNMLKGNIDYSKQKYDEKKNGGRKKKVDDIDIYRLAREGMNSAQIAQELGISKSAVDHSEGWRQRKSNDFVF